MSIIYYDELSIQRNIDDKLENIVTYSNKILEICNSMSVPYDFGYRDYLYSLDDKMKRSLGTIGKVQKKLSISKNAYTKIGNIVENSLIQIDNEDLNRRKTVVR